MGRHEKSWFGFEEAARQPMLESRRRPRRLKKAEVESKTNQDIRCETLPCPRIAAMPHPLEGARGRDASGVEAEALRQQ